MARLPSLLAFARKHRIKLVTIADLIKYRRRAETLVRESAATRLDNQYGGWDMRLFESLIDGRVHLAGAARKTHGKPVGP